MFDKLKVKDDSKNQTHFVWGVKSFDDLSGAEPGLYTMNDIEICYDSVNGTYILGLETLYEFANTEGKIKYLEGLLSSFHDYLDENQLFDLSWNPFNLYWYTKGRFFEAKSLTELYYKFKIFVSGFSSM